MDSIVLSAANRTGLCMGCPLYLRGRDLQGNAKTCKINVCCQYKSLSFAETYVYVHPESEELSTAAGDWNETLNLIWASVPKYTKVRNEKARHKLSKMQKVQAVAGNAIRCDQPGCFVCSCPPITQLSNTRRTRNSSKERVEIWDSMPLEDTYWDYQHILRGPKRQTQRWDEIQKIYFNSASGSGWCDRLAENSSPI